MKLNTLFKGLIMALVGFISTTLSDMESFNLAYILIASLGFTAIYLAKNAVFKSVSVIGLDLKDIISGLILAIGMGISSAAAQILTTGFNWETLWIAVIGAVSGYILKTLPSNAKK